MVRQTSPDSEIYSLKDTMNFGRKVGWSTALSNKVVEIICKTRKT